MKRILVIYYTQSGQGRRIVDGVLQPLTKKDNYKIDYFKITPEKDFPFPWNTKEFYDCMPECVAGDTIPVKAFDISDDYDLVILSYPIWFLSLAIPFWSMLQDEKLKTFLNGKKVITILGVRNMWVNAHKRLYKYFDENNVNHVGNLVFADPNLNLVSVITVIRFLNSGVKKTSKYLPPYGISDSRINEMKVFGELIDSSFNSNDWSNFQSEVIDNKGVDLEFSLKTTELAAGRIFKVWSSFIKKKGSAGNPKRQPRLKIYQFYLLFLIFFISPISSTIFKIIHLIFRPITQKGLDKISYLKKE
jgi:flavodoxin